MSTLSLKQKKVLPVLILILSTISFVSCSSTKKGSTTTAFRLGEGSGAETALVYNGPKVLLVDRARNIYYNTGGGSITKISSDGKTSLVLPLSNNIQKESSDLFATETPCWMAEDRSGNLFIANSAGNRIIRLAKTGKMNAFAGSGTPGSADGKGTAASFDQPSGLAIDSKGNILVADTLNNKIRKITRAGTVTTLAGSGDTGSLDGTGSTASFYSPGAITIDRNDNLYVVQQADSKIRRVTPDGKVTTVKTALPGGTPDFGGTNASFYYPNGIASAPDGTLFVSSYFFNTIVKINKDGRSTTIAGNGLAGFKDGLTTNAQFSGPMGLTLDGSGALYIADCGNNAIRVLQTR